LFPLFRSAESVRIAGCDCGFARLVHVDGGRGFYSMWRKTRHAFFGCQQVAERLAL
jgi:hypothetical protein